MSAESAPPTAAPTAPPGGGLAARSAAHDDLVARARAVLPGGTTNSVPPMPGQEFVAARGAGAWLYDVDGRRFLDFALGGGPLVLGHAHPRIAAALDRSARLGTSHFEVHHRTVELAERLVRQLPSADLVRFASSGSEATFHALRLARAVTGRSGVVKFDGGYHGHHDLATWSYEGGPDGLPQPHPESAGIQPGVAEQLTVLPYNDAAAVRATLRDRGADIAAVIVEPCQRSLAPLPGFLAALREECTRSGTVLVFDEMVTGFRLVPGSAQQRYGVAPDLTTLGKALSAGLPLSAIVGRRELMEHLGPGSDPARRSLHCGTLSGHLTAVEAAHASLEVLLDEGGVEVLAERSARLRELLHRTLADAGVPAYVSGEGPVFRIWFTAGEVHDAAQGRATDLAFGDAVHRLMREAGVYQPRSKSYVGLAHTDEHLLAYAERLRWALDRAAGRDGGPRWMV